MVRFPAPLRPGDTIGVTAPSSGVEGAAASRAEFCIGCLRGAGYEVVVGECMDGAGITSAPAEQRAAELTRMLTDPAIRLVLPPWGGETAIDLVDLLDWDALARADPTWLVGFSDLSTLLLPLTVRLGWATVHGDNLLDTPYGPPPGLLHWLDLVSGPGPHAQRDSGLIAGFRPFEDEPRATEWMAVDRGSWRLHGADRLEVTGRLIGGCVETVCNLTGSPYGDVAGFGRQNVEDGLIVYLEVGGDEAATICRNLHGLRLAGWFEHARAVLFGRTAAPDNPQLTQREAVLDALGPTGLPIVFDVEIGHVPPHLPLVNGALARLTVAGGRHELVQELPLTRVARVGQGALVDAYLETERLTLRRFTADDADLLVELDSDPAVMRYLPGGGEPTTAEDVRGRDLPSILSGYEKWGGDFGLFAAHAKGSGDSIGWFHLRPERGAPRAEVELGDRLRQAEWGKGYATEGCQALLHKGFTELDVRLVWAATMTANVASQKVMEKVGMTLAERIPTPPDMQMCEGAERGGVLFQIDRDRWRAAVAAPG